MRFKCEPTSRLGDFRVKKKFLLIPRKFGNEVRWLEFALIREEYVLFDFPQFCGWHEIGFY